MQPVTHVLEDGRGSFDVDVLEPPVITATVLFAVGGGGNPKRHDALLRTLAERRCLVVAPHFERLQGGRPTEEQLTMRAERLSLAMAKLGMVGVPVTGVGHSIGATMLLALAGAVPWLPTGNYLRIKVEAELTRLALMAPAADFFRAPNALDAVRTPVMMWAGSEDDITPPSQASFLQEALGRRITVELNLVEAADHFSFMDVLPPHVLETRLDRQRFLRGMADEISHFLTSESLLKPGPARPS